MLRFNKSWSYIENGQVHNIIAGVTLSDSDIPAHHADSAVEGGYANRINQFSHQEDEAE